MNIHYKLSSFLKGVMKMDDINPISEHDKTEKQPDTGETIPLTLSGMIGKNLLGNRTAKQKHRFEGGKTQSTRLKESFVKKLYQELSKSLTQTPELPFA